MVRTIAHQRPAQIMAAAFVALILAAYAISPAMASPRGAAAEVFIEELAAGGITMLETRSYSDTEREREFRRLVRKGFALDAIGQFVAGRHWRTMSEDQRAEFRDLFSEWMLTSYARQLGGYDGQTMEIISSVELDNRARDIVVRTRITHTGGQLPIAAAWRIRELGGELKIIDVIIEGVSMAAAQRAEYDAVIRKIGIEGLLDDLRSRLAVLVAGAE
ncbi:MAG: ABC transporter substrate-binding protein [Rhodospirillales bacterium]|nr:MAG: ABC transporter substrate-binding protein [Rhodospirillales bacterium]